MLRCSASAAAIAPAGQGVTQPTAVGAPGAGLRVCHLIGSLRYGGAERQVVNLLNHLPVSRRFLLLLSEPGAGDLIEELAPDVARAVVPLRLRGLPRALPAIRRLLRHWRIDVLHTHMFWPNLAGVLAGRWAGVPVIVTSEHGKNLWKRRAHVWAERHLITPRADLRICASEDIRQLRCHREGIPAEKLVCLPNGTELPAPAVAQERYPPLIGSVGRLVAAKDFPTLIAAAALLRDGGVPFRLCLVGDGPERTALAAAVARLRLQDHVELAGSQRNVSEWLRRFDLFVLSSRREGQPLALLEAMAHGLPIVATRVGGIPLTVADGSEAVLVPPEDPQALAAALRALLDDRERRRALGERARARVEREFSIPAVAARYVETYQDLWKRKHAVATR